MHSQALLALTERRYSNLTHDVPLVAGGFIALRCAFAFAWTGLGTPVPFDPPRSTEVGSRNSPKDGAGPPLPWASLLDV